MSMAVVILLLAAVAAAVAFHSTPSSMICKPRRTVVVVQQLRGKFGLSTALFQMDRKRAVGDVVQGLHGGKYQFGDTSSSSILPSFEGQQFAETGYGETSVESNSASDSLLNDPLPKWARRLSEFPLPNGSPTLSLSEKGSPTEIKIQNDERSWESYYAFIVGPLSEVIVIEPKVGQLAPRGGVKQFSDTAVLKVRVQDATLPMLDSGDVSWLVVGTEAERWFYRVSTTA